MSFFKYAFKFIQIILAVSIICLVTLLLFAHYGYINTVKPFVVNSGSMEPSVKTASVIFSYPFKTYNQGEIITFHPEGNLKKTVTHRIEFKLYPDGVGNPPLFITSGDANENIDTWKVKEEHIIGKAVVIVPFLGYLVDFAKKPYGFILLVIVPATIVIYEELKNLLSEIFKYFKGLAFKEGRTMYDNKQSQPKMWKIIPVVGAGIFMITFSASYFIDIEESIANIFQAGTWGTTSPSITPSPGITPIPTGIPSVQTGDVVINEIMWMGTQGDAADEWIELKNMTASSIDLSGWVIDNLGAGATNDIVIPDGLSIPANGYFMIANDTKETGNHDVNPDLIAGIQLQNPGEHLKLRVSVAGTIIDTADDDVNGWFAGVDPGGQNPERSMERNEIPGEGTDPNNWHSATAAVNIDTGERELATPKAPNSLP